MKEFKRHKYLNYEGYSFPPYMVIVWIGFLSFAIFYIGRNLFELW